MDRPPEEDELFDPLFVWIRASHRGPPATANTTTAASPTALLPSREEFLATSLSPCSFLADPSSPLWVAPDEECAICYGPLQHAVKLPCNHVYCKECILTWLANNNTCPMDRSVLFRVPPAPMSLAEETDAMLAAVGTRFTSRLWEIQDEYSRKLGQLKQPILEEMDNETRTLNQLTPQLYSLRASQMAAIPAMLIWDWQRLVLENEVADSRRRLRGHLHALARISSPQTHIWREASEAVLAARDHYVRSCHIVVQRMGV